jgi:hypothetical protein
MKSMACGQGVGFDWAMFRIPSNSLAIQMLTAHQANPDAPREQAVFIF